eukprot:5650790-Amphidinium_carterae.1
MGRKLAQAWVDLPGSSAQGSLISPIVLGVPDSERAFLKLLWPFCALARLGLSDFWHLVKLDKACLLLLCALKALCIQCHWVLRNKSRQSEE